MQVFVKSVGELIDFTAENVCLYFMNVKKKIYIYIYIKLYIYIYIIFLEYPEFSASYFLMIYTK